MSMVPSESSAIKSRTLLITWLLASGLALFLVENLWVDAWLRAKFGDFSRLVPETLTSLWFVMSTLGGLVCVVLVVCLVLVSRHPRISLWGKVCTGVVVVGVCLLWGSWLGATGGAWTASAGAAKHKHSVTLTWNASTSPVAGYNVYRSMVQGRDYVKINAKLIRDRLSYKDKNVESGKTYYYVTRSVDAKGNESEDSDETTVVVP